MESRLPPPPPPPDPTLPEFNKRVELQKQGKLLEARAALADFIEHYPESTKLDEARNRLGEINSQIFLSTFPAPEKEIYIVKSGDVLNKVASRLKTTPELIMKCNGLENIMLRIGQKLMVTPSDFSVEINRKDQKVVLRNRGKFFKQYPILAMSGSMHGSPAGKKGGATPKPVRLTGKLSEKISWADGNRITFTDKGFANADHWIVFTIPGYTLYSYRETGSEGAKPQKPPAGLGLAPDHMHEIATMLSKNTPVTVE